MKLSHHLDLNEPSERSVSHGDKIQMLPFLFRYTFTLLSLSSWRKTRTGTLVDDESEPYAQLTER